MQFSEKQMKTIQQSDARINIWQGAVRSGKTHATYYRWAKYVLDGPAGRLFMVGKTLETLRENLLDPMKELFNGELQYSDSGRRISFVGREIRGIGANDEKSKSKIQGGTCAGALCDEVTLFPESFFKMLLSRLSVKNAKLFGTCNPEGPYHWLKTDFIDNDKLDIKSFHFTIDENPFLPAEYVESLKNEYVGVWYLRYIFGNWALADGIIYDMFEAEKHVIDASQLKFKHYIAALDYGTSNPFAFGIFGYDTHEKIVLLKEYYYDSAKRGHQKTDGEYADAVIKEIRGYPVEKIFCDPSALSFITELYRRKLPAVKADNSVIDGLRSVAEMIASGAFVIDNSCINTVKEFQTYSWDANAQKRGEDKPLKDHDHAMDMLRYCLYSQFGKMGPVAYGGGDDNADNEEAQEHGSRRRAGLPGMRGARRG